jgi:hypothetical protein
MDITGALALMGLGFILGLTLGGLIGLQVSQLLHLRERSVDLATNEDQKSANG